MSDGSASSDSETSAREEWTHVSVRSVDVLDLSQKLRANSINAVSVCSVDMPRSVVNELFDAFRRADSKLSVLDVDTCEFDIAPLSEVLEGETCLETLRLRQTGQGLTGTRVLARVLHVSTTLARLHLMFESCGDAGVCLLARELSNPKQPLRELSLVGVGMGNASAKELAHCLMSNGALVDLDLSQNLITATGVVALAEMAKLHPFLGRLDLSFNQLGDEGAQALAACLPFTRLFCVNLGSNHVTDVGAEALLLAFEKSQYLLECNMYENKISSALLNACRKVLTPGQGAESRFQSAVANGDATEIKALLANGVRSSGATQSVLQDALVEGAQIAVIECLLQDRFGLQLAALISPSVFFDEDIEVSLKEMVVRAWRERPQSNSISVVAKNDVPSKLTEALEKFQPESGTLDLNGVVFDSENIPQVVAIVSEHGARLQRMWLAGCLIGPDAISLFGNSFANLSVLNLSTNELRDAGVAALAKLLVGSQVNALSLGNNQIGPNGALHLQTIIKNNALKSLDVQKNRLGNLGAGHLADALQDDSHLTLLVLVQNEIEEEGGVALHKALLGHKELRVFAHQNDLSKTVLALLERK